MSIKHIVLFVLRSFINKDMIIYIILEHILLSQLPGPNLDLVDY